RAMSIDDFPDPGVKRHSAKAFEPRNAHAFETPLERTRKAVSRFVDRERRTWIGSGDRAQNESEIGNRTSQASGSTQGGPSKSGLGIRDTADRRTKTYDVAKCGGIS